jgi:hypothetical protein
MRPAATRLLEALRRDPQAENQLTKLFACVLQAHPELARGFVELVGLTPGTHVDVSTQVPTRVGARTMDIEVRVMSGDAVIGRVWDETSSAPGSARDRLPETSRRSRPSRLERYRDQTSRDAAAEVLRHRRADARQGG